MALGIGLLQGPRGDSVCYGRGTPVLIDDSDASAAEASKNLKGLPESHSS